MITVEEAKRIMMAQVVVRSSEDQLLKDACGRVLSDDVIARYDHPLFDMSAVDGYALGDASGPWHIVGTVAAGEVLGRSIRPGECVRIFTGALVPTGSHCVVMQEVCTMSEGALILAAPVPANGANIRRRGEGARAGDALLRRGSRLDVAGVGLLASCGIANVSVVSEVQVSIVRTGGEFNKDGELRPGRIFSSNELMLIAAAEQAGFNTPVDPFIANDTEVELVTALSHAVAESDAVVTTGGASVGDHDLMLPVLKKLGAMIHFHGVAQKPGKPMLFATLNGVPVFALPGNPRAVLVGWYEYVLPFLRACCGLNDPWLRSDRLPLTHPVQLKGERAEFRAARVQDGKVTLLSDEGSHLLGTLAHADAIAYFPHDVRAYAAHDPVTVHYLPYR